MLDTEKNKTKINPKPHRIFFCNQEYFETVVKKQITTRMQNLFCETHSQFKSLIMRAIIFCCVHIAVIMIVLSFLL